MDEPERRSVELSDEDMDDPPPVEEDDSADDDYHGTQEQPADNDAEEDGDAMSLDDDNDEFAEAPEYQDKAVRNGEEEDSEPEINYIGEFPEVKQQFEVVPPTWAELGTSSEDYKVPAPPKVLEVLAELGDDENGHLCYRARLKGGEVKKACSIPSLSGGCWG